MMMMAHAYKAARPMSSSKGVNTIGRQHKKHRGERKLHGSSKNEHESHTGRSLLESEGLLVPLCACCFFALQQKIVIPLSHQKWSPQKTKIHFHFWLGAIWLAAHDGWIKRYVSGNTANEQTRIVEPCVDPKQKTKKISFKLAKMRTEKVRVFWRRANRTRFLKNSITKNAWSVYMPVWIQRDFDLAFAN
jgi:hypothetical protein